jgi:flagellar protein FlaH
MGGGPGTPEGKRSDVYGFQLKGDELHKKLGNGIPKGSIMLIEGEEGSGRSVMCQRLLYGLLMDERSVSYISTEMTIRDFIDQMYSLNYKIDKFMLSRKLQFFPVYPLLGNVTNTRDNFLDKLITSPMLYQSDVLIVDSMSTLVKSNFNEKDIIKLLAFLKKLSQSNKSIILTVEKGHTALEPLRLASDIYICLDIKQVAGSLARIISIKRFSRARGEVGDSVRYRIEAGVGMIIEITEVSG